MTEPTHIVWRGAGSPDPFDAFGDPIPKARKGGGKCAKCGSPEGHWDLNEVVSNSFTSVRNDNRMSGYGGRNYCAACVFASRTLRLRCISWFAREDGIRFWRTRPESQEAERPDALAALLDPPEPPFVAGVPLYGISHGGEANWLRTPWRWNLKPENVLIKLQSKHVAIYARTGFSRDRYPVQVDDSSEFVLDRDLWLRLRDAANEVTRVLIADGVPPYPAKLMLKDLSLPKKVSPAVAAAWPRLTGELRRHSGATWWRVFNELYPTPKEATKEATSATTREHPDSERLHQKHEDGKAPARVPAQGSRPQPERRENGKGQVLLPFG